MTCLQQLRRLASRAAVLALMALLAVLDSCTSTSDLPSNLPDIALNGSSATPQHHMASYEYPFDSSGNYVSDWAAEGERRAGRSPIATNSDEENWKNSHGKNSAASKTKKYGSSKTKSSSEGKKPSGSKTGSTKPKSGNSSKYVVKSSDTLAGIARKFGTTTTAIKKTNGLKSDKVRGGTVLVIPK
jgi:LysM repeat protein